MPGAVCLWQRVADFSLKWRLLQGCSQVTRSPLSRGTHGQIGYKGGEKWQATLLIRVKLSGTHLQSFTEPGKVALKPIIYPEIVYVDSKAVLRAPIACAVCGHLMQSPLVPGWTKHSENATGNQPQLNL